MTNIGWYHFASTIRNFEYVAIKSYWIWYATLTVDCFITLFHIKLPLFFLLSSLLITSYKLTPHTTAPTQEILFQEQQTSPFTQDTKHRICFQYWVPNGSPLVQSQTKPSVAAGSRGRRDASHVARYVDGKPHLGSELQMIMAISQV